MFMNKWLRLRNALGYKLFELSEVRRLRKRYRIAVYRERFLSSSNGQSVTFNENVANAKLDMLRTDVQ